MHLSCKFSVNILTDCQYMITHESTHGQPETKCLQRLIASGGIKIHSGLAIAAG